MTSNGNMDDARRRYIEGHSRNLGDASSYLHSDHNLVEELVLEMKYCLDAGARVLEVGCGGGHAAALLDSAGFKVTATDLSPVAVDAAKSNYPHIDFVCADACDLPFDDETFDSVVAIELIEHLTSPMNHVKEAGRVLVEGGQYFVKTPNRPLHDLFYRNNETVSQWHPSVMSAAELRTLLSAGGFEVRFVRMKRLPAYQVKKLLSRLGRAAKLFKPLAERVPLGLLPPEWQPSLIAVAKGRGKTGNKNTTETEKTKDEE